MEAIREQEFRRRAEPWTPVDIGSIATIAAALIVNPIVAVSAVGVGIAIQVIQTAQGKRTHATNIAQGQALLVELDRELHWDRSWLGCVFH